MIKVKILRGQQASIVSASFLRWHLDTLKIKDSILYVQWGKKFAIITPKDGRTPRKFISANFKTTWKKGRVRLGVLKKQLNIQSILGASDAIREGTVLRQSCGLLNGDDAVHERRVQRRQNPIKRG